MSTAALDDLAAIVKEALRVVIDPELGYNIVDLGLIYDVAVEDGGNGGIAHVAMTTTTRGCPATSYLQNGAEDAAASVPGIASVDVTLTYDPPWTPEMMTDDAKQHLGIGARSGW
ncbi:MAG TPA: metal-sulfur cluster assembly factor [Pseudolabrys sp.]|nr:metal-sulfur cluster assembly factor [Pseudolabrys sp.]